MVAWAHRRAGAIAAVLGVAVSIGLPVAPSQARTPKRPKAKPTPTAQAPTPATAEPSGDPDEGEPGSDGDAQPKDASGAPTDPAARAAWLVAKADAALAAHPLGRGRLGAVVIDLATHQVLWRHEPDAAFNLASTTKVLTTAAALATLGPGFRWRTALYADGLDLATGEVTGDLYVRGRGDPTLGGADLRDLAGALAAKGVRSVRGKLVVDGTYFDDVVEPPRYGDQPKERAGFRAPVAAFAVSRGAVNVDVVGLPGGGATVSLAPPAGDAVRLTQHQVVSTPTGRTRIRVDAVPHKGFLEIKVSGQISLADGDYETRRRVDDPVGFAAAALRAALAERGVTIKDQAVGHGAVPTTARLLAAHDSAPLAEVVRAMNKTSDNFVAETLLKTLGAETRTAPGPATWADGTAAVATYLKQAGVTGDVRAENGSGLFGSTAVTPTQLTQLLVAAYHDFRVGPDLMAALPIGGVDGTLARRWRGHAARGRVRAKTGTLDHVVTLAGYLAVDAGHPLAFAILVNDVSGGQRAAARATADALVDLLTTYLGG